jgi:polysaccharide biosynthesis protein PslE
MNEHDDQPTGAMNARDVFTILFKHKYMIVIVFSVIVITSILVAATLPVRYQASATLFVKFGREFIQRTEAGEKVTNIAPQAIIQTEVALMTGRRLIEDIVRALGPQSLYPELADKSPRGDVPVAMAASRFRSSLQVQDIPSTSMIQVTFVHSDPQIAIRAVKGLVDGFKEKHLQVFSGNSTAFLEQQFENYQRRLKDSENNLKQFKQEHMIFSLDEQRSSLLSQRTALESALIEVQNQIKEAEHKLSFARSPNWTGDIPPEARAQLLSLEQKERELLQKYTEDSKAAKDVRTNLEAMKRSVQGLKADANKIEIAKIQMELRGMSAKADNIRRQLSDITGELRSLDKRTLDLLDLNRELASNESNYQTYLRRLEEARISDDLDRQKMVAISVVEEPTVTPESRPRTIKDRAIPFGFLGGIILALALAFAIEYASPTMTTPMSAERRLKLPVMVAIARKG